MFARILLILTLAFGLAAGPAMSPACAAAVQLECGCCPVEMESCCISSQDSDSREIPAKIVPSSVELRSVLAPVVVYLGVEVQTDARHPRVAAVETYSRGAGSVIDRICIRLI